jgi:hypothetical protein
VLPLGLFRPGAMSSDAGAHAAANSVCAVRHQLRGWASGIHEAPPHSVGCHRWGGKPVVQQHLSGCVTQWAWPLRTPACFAQSRVSDAGRCHWSGPGDAPRCSRTTHWDFRIRNLFCCLTTGCVSLSVCEFPFRALNSTSVVLLSERVRPLFWRWRPGAGSCLPMCACPFRLLFVYMWWCICGFSVSTHTV